MCDVKWVVSAAGIFNDNFNLARLSNQENIFSSLLKKNEKKNF